ncbi:hypothetical protein NA57DRAFT_54511 [Rhizodiscina lignyota]|uniref:CCHC-type domain-containing protein n=1 Tax=Rhizodiscina lignyota TaxID=1504668 RepID=A0A9P4MAJ1_9PEZI|nr:hypothetical protein NA57DRAFT_54511 [Rhizodiscina lignyota]
MASTNTQCWDCHGLGHNKRRCPLKVLRIVNRSHNIVVHGTIFRCHLCGTPGHFKDDCRHLVRPLLPPPPPPNRQCRLCGQQGHPKWACPQRWSWPKFNTAMRDASYLLKENTDARTPYVPLVEKQRALLVQQTYRVLNRLNNSPPTAQDIAQVMQNSTDPEYEVLRMMDAAIHSQSLQERQLIAAAIFYSNVTLHRSFIESLHGR